MDSTVRRVINVWPDDTVWKLMNKIADRMSGDNMDGMYLSHDGVKLSYSQSVSYAGLVHGSIVRVMGMSRPPSRMGAIPEA